MPMPVSATLTTASLTAGRIASSIGSAGVRIFYGVTEQVAEDLREPDRIGFYKHRLFRKVDAKLNSGRIHLFLARSDRATKDDAEVEPLLFQLDLAMADPRSIEQIVDEPHQMFDLPLHHL